jgi:signal transduction histidine kinase
LTLLFLAVLVPPAITLVWLGVQLLEQDRNLWKQRDLERRQTAADAIVRSLDQMLSEAERWPAGHPVPEGALRVVVLSGEAHTDPPGLALWLPAPLAAAEADTRGFTDPEMLEFQGTAQRALIRYEELARSPQQSVRAGALLRIARVYRRGGQTSEALQAYRDLAAISGVAIADVPADLQARRAICDILDESGRKTELVRVAASLESDFLAGRWMLARPDWELTAGQIAGWTGHPLLVPVERKALTEAAEWLSEQSGHLDSSGRRVVAADVPVTVLWRADGAKNTGLAMAPSLVRKWLKAAAAGGTGQVSLMTDSGQALVGGTPSPGSEAVRRTAAETGLPWNVIVGPGDASYQSQDLATRRRLLSLGLGAIVLLLAGGSYMLWRVVQRELAVARLQTDFVSAVSHEFRTPLTSLRHVTELLQENDSLPPERRQTFYAALGRSTERLHRLVESLLDFGRMELGRKPYDLQPADAGAITAKVVADFENEAAAQGFTIHLQVDESAPPLRADAAALTRALWNLLDNAIKYSDQEREVWVSVDGSPDGVAIAVRDHGLGIPHRERKEIFRKFIRGEKAKQLGIKGTGLGLAMVSHIVEAHGGIIELESEEGRGSTFRLVLPARG